MIYKKLIYGLALAGAMQLYASPVSLHEAQNVALNWMKITTGKSYKLDTKTPLGLSDAGSKTNNAMTRLILLKPRGWVIVSSDDVARPVIGYGQSQIDMTNLSPEFEYWVDGVNSIIKKAASLSKSSTGLGASQSSYSSEWQALKKDPQNNDIRLGSSASLGGGSYVVKPLLWMGGSGEDSGIRWDQTKYYNRYVPQDPSLNNDTRYAGHVPVGCVAVAMGQVMKYYGKPAVGTGSHSYIDDTYGRQSANFANTAYDWSNMPRTLDDTSTMAQRDAVDTLLYHVGVSVDMEYHASGSIAYYGGDTGAAHALQQYFGYTNAKSLERSKYADSDWNRMIRESLGKGAPVLYGGTRSNQQDGHAFVLDGYTSSGYYHFNFGWDGYLNGDFLIDNITPHDSRNRFDFSYYQMAVFLDEVHDANNDNNNNNDNNSGGGGGALGYLIPLFGLVVLYRRKRYAI